MKPDPDVCALDVGGTLDLLHESWLTPGRLQYREVTQYRCARERQGGKERKQWGVDNVAG